MKRALCHSMVPHLAISCDAILFSVEGQHILCFSKKIIVKIELLCLN
jgi:hypothetical protein